MIDRKLMTLEIVEHQPADGEGNPYPVPPAFEFIFTYAAADHERALLALFAAAHSLIEQQSQGYLTVVKQ